MLEMILLGRVVIQRDGQPVQHFRSQAEIALLVYLAHSGQTHSREALAEILWPGRTTRQGLANLRTTLARVQRHIDTELIVTRKTLTYRPEARPYVDSVRLQTELQDFGPLSSPADISRLHTLLHLYRGDFLVGFYLPNAPPFNDWAVVENEHLRQLVLAGSEMLVTFALASPSAGSLSPILKAARRWLDLDPFNETAHGYMMRLLAGSGHPAAALVHYNQVVDLLAAEMGVEPEPGLLNLAAQIRAGMRGKSADTAAGSPAHSLKIGGLWPSDELMPSPADPLSAGAIPRQLPLVGRAHEIQQLVKAYRRAGQKHLQVVVVSGKSGIGKSRLAAEFLNWVGPTAADVLQGQAFESAGRIPYLPIITALRERLEQENAPEDILDDIWLAELSHILPELRARYPDLPPTTGGEATAQSRLFEAVARLGLALAARRPLLWLIDDLQWADTGTIDLIHYLIRRWRKEDAPILLLFTVRQEARIQETTLADWLNRLGRETDVIQLKLAPVKSAGLQQLTIHLAGANALGTAEFSAWLAQETGGQPLILNETLKFLDDKGVLVWSGENGDGQLLDPLATMAHLEALGSQELQPALNDVILARLERLSWPAAALLAAAAVIDQESSLQMLRQTADADEQAGLNALNELLAAQLIKVTTDHSRPFVVFHDRIRETVYAELSPPQREQFHDRALMTLASMGDPPAILARHAFIAHQWPAAFHHSLAAGEGAKAQYALATAVEHFETALNILRQEQVAVDEATDQRLFLKLGRSHELNFHFRQALAVYEEMSVWAVKRQSQAMELAALVARCEVLALPYDAHDVGQAAELVRQAVPLARTRGDLKAETQLEQVQVQLHKYGDGQIAPALSHARAAVSLARQAGQNEQLALALINLASLDASSGQLERAESSLQEAEKLFRAVNHRPKLQDVFHSFAMIRLGTGRLDEALAYLDQADQVNEALNSPTEQLALAGTRSVVYLIRGEYGRALAGIQPLLEGHEAEIAARVRVESYQQLAWTCCDTGAYEKGLQYCQQAIANHEEIEPTGRIPAFAILTLLYIEQGQLEEAAAALARGLAYFDLQQIVPGWWWESPSILLAQGKLALAQGKPTQALQPIEQLLLNYDELSMRHLKPEVLTLQANILRALGNDEAAHRLLAEALALSDTIGARRGVWAICSALGELKSAQGDHSAAAQLRARSRKEATFMAEQMGGFTEKTGLFADSSEITRVVE